ncbi:hypothetical protein H0H81_012011, partial [Sphagnurus paluster]
MDDPSLREEGFPKLKRYRDMVKFNLDLGRANSMSVDDTEAAYIPIHELYIKMMEANEVYEALSDDVFAAAVQFFIGRVPASVSKSDVILFVRDMQLQPDKTILGPLGKESTATCSTTTASMNQFMIGSASTVLPESNAAPSEQTGSAAIEKTGTKVPLVLVTYSNPGETFAHTRFRARVQCTQFVRTEMYDRVVFGLVVHQYVGEIIMCWYDELVE